MRHNQGPLLKRREAARSRRHHVQPARRRVKLCGAIAGTGQLPERSVYAVLCALDSAADPGTLSEAAQAKLYRTLMLQSGTFSIADTIVAMNTEHGKNPTQKANTWRWSYALKGDTLLWHVLNAQGKVTGSGKSVRAVRHPPGHRRPAARHAHSPTRRRSRRHPPAGAGAAGDHARYSTRPD